MGILTGVARILGDLATEYRFGGELAMLGKQNVIIAPDQWEGIRGRCPRGDLRPVDTERHLRWRTDFLSTEYFFRTLGFSAVSAVDVSAYEGAAYICDLNAPDLPPELHDRFDFVFDGSTIEHIFHLPNVFANIFRMLRVGGRVLHMAPSNQFMDDGFYQLSPTLFVDYYGANGFRTDVALLHYMKIVTATTSDGARVETEDRVVPYDPEALNRVSAAFASHGDELCQTFFMATKTAASTSGRVPWQSRYATKDYWRAHLGTAASLTSGREQ